jgi:hypothetical protein
VTSDVLEPAPWAWDDLPALGSRWRTTADLDLGLGRPYRGPSRYDGNISRTPPPACPQHVPAGTRLRYAGVSGYEDPCTYIFPEGLRFEITDSPHAGGVIVVYPTGQDDPEMALVRAIVPETGLVSPGLRHDLKTKQDRQ